MFPLAHAWMIEQCVPDPTLAHYLGSVWPDMLYGNPLTHQQTHRGGAALVAYAAALPPGDAAGEFRQFVLGADDHALGARDHRAEALILDGRSTNGRVERRRAFSEVRARDPLTAARNTSLARARTADLSQLCDTRRRVRPTTFAAIAGAW